MYEENNSFVSRTVTLSLSLSLSLSRSLARSPSLFSPLPPLPPPFSLPPLSSPLPLHLPVTPSPPSLFKTAHLRDHTSLTASSDSPCGNSAEHRHWQVTCLQTKAIGQKQRDEIFSTSQRKDTYDACRYLSLIHD